MSADVRSSRRWPWLVPVAVFAVTYWNAGRLGAVAAATIGTGVVWWVARRPGPWTVVLLTLLPFDLFASAALYRLGVPASVLRPIRYWPELILAGLALAGLVPLWSGQVRWRRLDALDAAALAYGALATLYLLAPKSLVEAPVGRDLSLYARALGWRTDAMYVAAFLVARRLPLDRALRQRLPALVAATGTFVAALGLVEFVTPGGWNAFAAGLLHVPRYQRDITHALPIGSGLDSVEAFGRIGGTRLVRVGSVLDYESLGFYLALCLGIVADRVSRHGAPRWMYRAVPVLGVGLLVTQTRSGILAGVIAAGLALRPRAGRREVDARRLVAIAAAAVALAVVANVSTGFGTRLAGDQVSNQAHGVEVSQGVHALVAYPLGRGLSTSGPQYKRSALGGTGLSVPYTGAATGILVTDDQWLAVGTELGFVGLALYLVLCVLLLRRLGRTGSGDGAGEGLRNAAVGILIGGTFLQPFINEAVSLSLFVLAGLATSDARPGAVSPVRSVSVAGR
ncbi:MAG TPA: hypothetical protein VKI19_07495 [Acidimicrobiales bacterium]|nr:hypothetical protein [Acidimicrobiales bacterium]